MHDQIGLDEYLQTWAGVDDLRHAVSSTINVLAAACCQFATNLAIRSFGANLAERRHRPGRDDFQTELDLQANTFLLQALGDAPVAAVVSDEMEVPFPLKAGAPILVALDPLDDSSNIEANVPIGTIFSLLRNPSRTTGAEPAVFLRSGSAQIAAGYIIYGPQTVLALTVGAGTHIFTFELACRKFVCTNAHVCVPQQACEFAINASNYRHWDPSIQTWFNDCLTGAEGPRGRDFNMRWIASIVTEAHHILKRGGVYLYPSDARRGYGSGRVRLLCEANPIALLIEQAGGRASTGRQRILNYAPHGLHERVPFVFGAGEEVERIERYQLENVPKSAASPLFAKRGLFV